MAFILFSAELPMTVNVGPHRWTRTFSPLANVIKHFTAESYEFSS